MNCFHQLFKTHEAEQIHSVRASTPPVVIICQLSSYQSYTFLLLCRNRSILDVLCQSSFNCVLFSWFPFSLTPYLSLSLLIEIWSWWVPVDDYNGRVLVSNCLWRGPHLSWLLWHSHLLQLNRSQEEGPKCFWLLFRRAVVKALNLIQPNIVGKHRLKTDNHFVLFLQGNNISKNSHRSFFVRTIRLGMPDMFRSKSSWKCSIGVKRPWKIDHQTKRTVIDIKMNWAK